MENSNTDRVIINTMADRAEKARQQEEAKMLTEANQQAEAAKMHQEEIDKIEKRKAVNNFFIKSIQFGLALAIVRCAGVGLVIGRHSRIDISLP